MLQWSCWPIHKNIRHENYQGSFHNGNYEIGLSLVATAAITFVALGDEI